MAPKASGQLAFRSLPFSRTHGVSSRRRFNPSWLNRALSASHSSFTASFVRGRMRSTSDPRASIRMFVPSASCTSTLSVFRNSHGRAVKLYGLFSSAPTGQMSIRLPDSSELSAFSM